MAESKQKLSNQMIDGAPRKRSWIYHSPSFESDVLNPGLSTSPWSGHRYFAYDLIAATVPGRIVELGTHYGCSFFAFAQVIKDKSLKSELIAVDTWKGEEHAGFYGESVFELVKRTVDDRFADVEITLLRKTFDDALADVSDGSVDLLHIDGFHSYEAVRHDYETWAPKLAENAIVLFHDVAPSSGYGSADYWKEIRREHPHVEFLRHSFGLGVLFPKGDKHLQDYKPKLRRDHVKLYAYRAEAELYKRQVVDTEAMLNERWKIIEQMDNEIANRTASLSSFQAEAETLRVDLERRITELDAQKSWLETELSRKDDLLVSQAEARAGRIAELEFETKDLVRRIGEADERASAGERDRARLQDELTQREAAVAELNTLLAARDCDHEALVRDFEQLSSIRDGLVNERDRFVQGLDNIVRERDGLVIERDRFVQELGNIVRERAGLVNERDILVGELDIIVRERDGLVNERDRFVQELGNIVRERDGLVNERDILVGELDIIVRERDGLVNERDRLVKDRDDIVAERSRLETAFAASEAQVRSLVADGEFKRANARTLTERLSDMQRILDDERTQNASNLARAEVSERTAADRRAYRRLVESYSGPTPRAVFDRLLSGPFDGKRFPEMAITFYAFTRLLTARLREAGVRDVFFLAREGEVLKNMFDVLQARMYPAETDRIRSHYLKVSRRATFLMSLKPLDEEDFHVLFRQYRRIAPAEFLRSLALDDFIPSIAEGIGRTAEDLSQRCEDLPTDPLLAEMRASDVFKRIYEGERIRRRDNFAAYIDQFGANLVEHGFHIVDVGWKGSIQDNLYNWMSAVHGSHVTVSGYYLGLIATGSRHESNTKEGLLLNTVDGVSRGARIMQENKSLFEILLPASHGSASDYVNDASGGVYAVDETYHERDMIEAHVRPIVEQMLDLYYVVCDLVDHHAYTLDSVVEDALRYHRRMVFAPRPAETNWFHSVSHVENFGVFEATGFSAGTRPPGILDRLRFTWRLRRREFARHLGFWPWLKLKDNAISGVDLLYGIRQTHKR
jgi:predicted O-methyltransferase YrrM